MCMKISKEGIIRINNGFGGSLRNEASLDSTLNTQNNKKLGKYKKLAYLFRAILVYHVFSDGNKKTAVFIALAFAEQYNKTTNDQLLMHHTHSIASKNVNRVRNIELRLKNAIQ